MNYQIPEKTLNVDGGGSVPTITFRSNQSSTHFHVQVKTDTGWKMVVDATGLGVAVALKGGPISTAADLKGKKLFWDITLANMDATHPVEAVLDVHIEQDGNTLVAIHDDHNITGQESYYEILDVQ